MNICGTNVAVVGNNEKKKKRGLEASGVLITTDA
jgi:hypothetical protein